MATSADFTERTRSVSDPSSPDYNAQSPFYDSTVDSSSKFYVGPIVDTSPSGDDIRNEVTREVDQENAGHDNWLQKILDPIFRDPTIQDKYEKKIEERRESAKEGLDIRQTGGAPSTVWANATHEQMNEAISQNADPSKVAVASEEWVVVGNQLAEHQKNLAEAITDSTSNWQGAGGDAAREHLAAVGKWLGTTAQGATLTGHQQQLHSQALNETQKRMEANPPVAFSVQDANARLQTITDPVQYAQAADQEMAVYKEQQAAREQAARVMSDFDTTVGGAVETPAFAAPPKLASRTAASRAMGASSGGGAGAGGAGAAGLPDGATDGSNPALMSARSGVPGLENGFAGGAGAGGAGAGGAPQFDAASGGGGGAGLGGIGGGAGAGGGFGGGAGGGAGGAAFDPSQVPGLDVSGAANGANFGGGAGGGALGGGGFSGAGAPGLNVPSFDDSTSASGFTPPASTIGGGGVGGGIGGAPGLNVPSFNDSNSPRGGSPLGGIGGPGAFPGGTGGIPGIPGSGLPTGIGRDGGVNGGIGSRLNPIEPGGIKGGGLGGIGGGAGGGAGGGLGGLGKGGIPSLGGGGGGVGGGSLGGGGVGGSGAGSLGAGAASGAAGSAAAAEAAAARGAAGGGAAGRPGSSGMGMGGMGGAGKGGEEDKEHKLADYLEPDDPSIFAPDQVVAPPVIGDWKNTDWK